MKDDDRTKDSIVSESKITRPSPNLLYKSYQMIICANMLGYH